MENAGRERKVVCGFCELWCLFNLCERKMGTYGEAEAANHFYRVPQYLA
jgi:hypothetical protein